MCEWIAFQLEIPAPTVAYGVRGSQPPSVPLAMIYPLMFL
jgi:hypothetical protein